MANPVNKLPVMGKALRARLVETLLPAFRNLLQVEAISDDLQQVFSDVYLPMADWLDRHHPGRLQLIGLSGAQGAGKSTLARILQLLLSEGFGKRVQVLSLDDLYLQPLERKQLAQSVHPLFATRGVPGTHDIALGLELLEKLRQQHGGDIVHLPRFDKARDRRHPQSAWTPVTEPLDVLIVEGWCVGALPQPEVELASPVNDLERQHDPQGIWRRASNRALAGEYQRFFRQLDLLLMMRVPAMEHVYRWRALQESKLGAGAAMEPEKLRHFIMHYERLTLAQLGEMPMRADLVVELDEDHQIREVRLKAGDPGV